MDDNQTINYPPPKQYPPAKAYDNPYGALITPYHDMQLINERRQQGVSDKDIAEEIRQMSITYDEHYNTTATEDAYLESVMENAHKYTHEQLSTKFQQQVKANQASHNRKR